MMRMIFLSVYKFPKVKEFSKIMGLMKNPAGVITYFKSKYKHLKMEKHATAFLILWILLDRKEGISMRLISNRILILGLTQKGRSLIQKLDLKNQIFQLIKLELMRNLKFLIILNKIQNLILLI